MPPLLPVEPVDVDVVVGDEVGCGELVVGAAVVVVLEPELVACGDHVLVGDGEYNAVALDEPVGVPAACGDAVLDCVEPLALECSDDDSEALEAIGMICEARRSEADCADCVDEGSDGLTARMSMNVNPKPTNTAAVLKKMRFLNRGWRSIANMDVLLRNT